MKPYSMHWVSERLLNSRESQTQERIYSMKYSDDLQVSLTPDKKMTGVNPEYDIDRIIYDLDSRIDMLSSKADSTDYLVAIASGLLCGTLDVLWVGNFNLERGRVIAGDQIEEFVKKTSHMFGCESNDLKECVKALEDRFPLASDGNTPDFGGGLQHHLRDFSHHPTPAGLAFSLLTQFTGKSYGTDRDGVFIIRDIPEKSLVYIGEDIPEKILYGTVYWFFHLISDFAGSSNTAGLSGGTGIPGPILSMVKEMSCLPLFRNLKHDDYTVSELVSKLFNGTLLAQHDENGKIIKDTVLKFDLRGEFGLATEIGRQALPVIANECIVRTFYFLRRFASEIKEKNIRSIQDLKKISWNNVKPSGNPTVDRMLTIATGVFTTIDVTDAVISQKYWLSVNYVGVGRFAVALGTDVAWCLKARDVKKIRQMYETIQRNTYTEKDGKMYARFGNDMGGLDRFGLTIEQTEILYNLEYQKTLNDILCTKLPIRNEQIRDLKIRWLAEWQLYMTNGFSSFLNVPGAKLHWYSKEELLDKIRKNEPKGTWFRLVLLETMLFEPYFTLSVETDKKGKEKPSSKYNDLQNPVTGYKKSEGDQYLDKLFQKEEFYTSGYIRRLRKCYDKVVMELNEVLKTVITTLSITAGVLIVTIATAGSLAPQIAVALVGSNFAGLSGAALTSASLAYLGGGAIAAGGLGMAGGTFAIVGGGAALGFGVGAGVGGAVGAAGLLGKKNTIMQSAKLLVSIREIFLNDEHDLAYSNTVYEQYVRNVADTEKELVELRLKEEDAKGEEKKKLKEQIKKTEESVNAMKVAKKSLNRFISSFGVGMGQ